MSASPPTVTGISPNEGHPGTKIIIRGEHLGRTQQDLVSIVINDDECVATAEWHSPNKITARCGRNQGTGPVIVTTRNGGRGTCTVSFRIYTTRIGLTTEVGYWYDEAKQWEARRGRIMFVSDGANPAAAVTSSDSGAHRSAATGIDDANPLGLDDPDEQVFGEEQLMRMFPETCGDLNLENFSPAWYILQHHSTASLRDLERALRLREERKRRERETSTSDMVLYVKDFLVSFFECVDTLDHLDARIGDDRRKLNDAIGGLNLLCTKMEQDIQASLGKISFVGVEQNFPFREKFCACFFCVACKQGTFGEIFSRRRHVEELKKISGVLSKYAYLWTTLSSINRARQSNNFTSIISETKKLRTLLEQVPANVFRQIMQAVDADIDRLNRHLHDQLLAPDTAMPGLPDEQIHIAELISELGIDRHDALWACIKQLHAYTIEQMRQFFVNKSLAFYTGRDLSSNGHSTLPKISAYLTRKAYFEPNAADSTLFSGDSVFDNIISSFVETDLGLISSSLTASAPSSRLSTAIAEWTHEIFTLVVKRCEHLVRLYQRCNHRRAAVDEFQHQSDVADVAELQKRICSLLEQVACQACIALETLLKFAVREQNDFGAARSAESQPASSLNLKPRHLVVIMSDAQTAVKQLLDLGSVPSSSAIENRFARTMPATMPFTNAAVQHLKFFTRGAGLAIISAVLKQAENDAKLLCLTALLNHKALELLPRLYETLLYKLVSNLATVEENDNSGPSAGDQLRCFNRATAESIASVLQIIVEMPLTVFDDKNWRENEQQISLPPSEVPYLPTLLSILALLKLRYNIIPAVLHVLQLHSSLLPNEFLHQLQLQLFQHYADRQNLLAALFIETTVQQLFMRDLRVEMENLSSTVKNVWSPPASPPLSSSPQRAHTRSDAASLSATGGAAVAADSPHYAPARECFVKFLMRILQRMNDVTALVNDSLAGLQPKSDTAGENHQQNQQQTNRCLFSSQCREIIEQFLQDYCQALAISLATELNRYIRLEKLYDKQQTASALGCIYIVQNSLQRFLSDDGHFLLNSASEWVLECFERGGSSGSHDKMNGENDGDGGKAAVVRLVKHDVDLFFKRNAVMLSLSKMSAPSE